MKLCKVLQAEIVMRAGDSWRRPAVGDEVTVSDEAAATFVARGYLELVPVKDEPPAAPQVRGKRRQRDEEAHPVTPADAEEGA